MRVETKKTLISDDNKKFTVGSDIIFDYVDFFSGEKMRVILEITEIADNYISGKNVEINHSRYDGTVTVLISGMSNANYVYYD